MLIIFNHIKTFFVNIFYRFKNNKMGFDELSYCLLTIALATVFILIFIGLPGFAFLSWIPLVLTYWRTLSSNKARRYHENQTYLKYYVFANRQAKKIYRHCVPTKDHQYFNCSPCGMKLRIPKRTGHIKLTCPECNHSFVKKTIRGHFQRFKQKLALIVNYRTG